jgi:hypothetical protein
MLHRGARDVPRSTVGGWSVGDTAFHDVDQGGIIHVVIGSISENQIQSEGATCAGVCCRALDQAAVGGMLPGWPRPAV